MCADCAARTVRLALAPFMTSKPSSRSATSSARSRESRLSALHLSPESLGFALDCAAQAVGAVRLGAALPAALQSAFMAVPEGNAENGRKLFVSSYCSACHGTMGQGSTAGARLAPRPIAFAAFEKYLRQPTGQMVPYTRAVLPDRDLVDIYAYVRSISPATPARNIPLLGQ